LHKLKEFSEKLKKFLEKKLKDFFQKLMVLPSRLGFYCRKTSKKRACLIKWRVTWHGFCVDISILSDSSLFVNKTVQLKLSTIFVLD